MTVVLNEVVNRITGNVDRFNTDLKYYVGGEHYDCGSLAIYNPGLLDSEKGKVLGFKFHFPFKSGDVLFMARNPHLRKASVVMFDGLCSDASYILRTKNENILRQKFLIFIIQNDLFWKFFEENKSGSVNYLMNWKEMQNYTFNLPSIEVQDKVIEIGWTIESLRKKYQEMLNLLELSIEAKFFDLFPETNNWEKKNIKDVFTLQMGKTPPRDVLKYWEGTCKWISIADLGTYDKYTEDTKEKLTEEAIEACGIKSVPENTVLMSFKLTIGKTAITSEEIYTNEAIMSFINRDNNVDNEYLRKFLEYKDWSEEAKHAVKGITLNKETIGNTLIAIPPYEIQLEFAEYVRKVDDAKNSIKNVLENLSLLLQTEIYKVINKED